jgi:hypothetical protein
MGIYLATQDKFGKWLKPDPISGIPMIFDDICAANTTPMNPWKQL